jgi:hypothetical protein
MTGTSNEEIFNETRLTFPNSIHKLKKLNHKKRNSSLSQSSIKQKTFTPTSLDLLLLVFSSLDGVPPRNQCISFSPLVSFGVLNCNEA